MKDDELLARLESDVETAGLDDRRLTMLQYSLKLTQTPWDMVEDDVAALRAGGHTDVDILHITEVVGYYA